MLRDQQHGRAVPVPGGFDDVETIEAYVIKGETIGSVSIAPQSDAALLYTTAVEIERITRLTLAEGDDDTRRSRCARPSQAVAFAPDGETALIIHKKAEAIRTSPASIPTRRSIARSATACCASRAAT